MISDRFRDRRVFWCGDAAHIWVPFAGYGTNAGIADAIHLSWKLPGVLNGWAEPAILDASELERQPVNQQASRYAMNTSFTRKSLGSAIPHNLQKLGPEGEAVRAHSGKSAYEQNVGQFRCGGQLRIFLREFSDYRVRRRGSPTRHDLRLRPVHSFGLPHAAGMVARWEDQCMTLCGLLFTLLRTDPAVETGSLLAAAAQRGVPMVVLDAGLEETASLCPWKLLSSRPDQHAAWRGDELPNDSIALIDRVHSACGET